MKNKSKRSAPSLIEAAGHLKRLKRTGWLKKAGITSDRESVADHCFRMAIIALVVGSELKVDTAKLVRMCLIHDLAESVLGDIIPEEKLSLGDHHSEEARIIHDILRQLPKKSKSVLEKDRSELFEMKTPEAKLAWQIDKMEMVFQAKDYIKMGYDKKRLEEFTKVKLNKILTKLVIGP